MKGEWARWIRLGIRLRKGVVGKKGKWDAFPVLKQKDQMDCGPACLRMLMKYYKMPEPDAHELSVRCEFSRTGVSVSDVIQAAQSFGFFVEAVKTQIAELTGAEKPCVLLWNTGHYVVHYGFEKNVHWIADPAIGLLKYTSQELQYQWCLPDSTQGVVLFLNPPLIDQRNSGKKGESSLWSQFWDDAPRFRHQFLWLGACFLFSGFFAMLLPLLFQVIVDVAVVQKDWSVLIVFVGAQLCLYVGQLSSQIVRTWIVLGMGTLVNLERVSRFFQQLVRLRWPFFANRMLGDIMLRIDDHKRIEKFLLGPAMELMMSWIQLFFLTLVLLRYSPLVFLLVFGAAVVYYIWYRHFLHQRAFMDYELFRREATHRSLLVEMIEGMQEIKISGAAPIRIRKWEALRRDYFYTQVKAMRIEEKQNAGIVLTGAVRDVVITAWTAHLAIEGEITIGMLFSIQFVVGQMGEPIRQWLETARMGQDARLSSQRIQDVYNEPVDCSSNAGVVKDDFGNSDVKIQFAGVRFAYPGTRAISVLNGLDLEFGRGFYAIVGESGCGKTSLLKLLLGFYQPQSGQISVEGCDLNAMDMTVWRKQCGVVLQDGYVFSDTLLANVAPAEDNPDPQKVQEVMRTCCLWDWVLTLPKKLETVVGKEGVGLSQGQRQRLLLARALYKDPRILLLDEATNALDVHTESVLWQNLQQVFESRITLIVAHRLSTVVNAKKIFVMKNGRIVEQGSHNQLIEKKAYYYELVKHQMYV